MPDYCCPLRRHFLIGIIGKRYDEPLPVEAGEFIDNFESPLPRIVTRFCPFCGASLAGQSTATTWTPNPPEVL